MATARKRKAKRASGPTSGPRNNPPFSGPGGIVSGGTFTRGRPGSRFVDGTASVSRPPGPGVANGGPRGRPVGPTSGGRGFQPGRPPGPGVANGGPRGRPEPVDGHWTNGRGGWSPAGPRPRPSIAASETPQVKRKKSTG